VPIVRVDVSCPPGPGVTEAGFSVQVGESGGVVSDGKRMTEHFSETGRLNPLREFIVIVAVAGCPGLTEEGVAVDAESPKEGTNTLNG
jgi:hypothetical protein